MSQSRLMSLVAAVANVLVGYGIAVLVQLPCSRGSACLRIWTMRSRSAGSSRL